MKNEHLQNSTTNTESEDTKADAEAEDAKANAEAEEILPKTKTPIPALET